MDIKRFPPSINLVATGHRITELREERGFSVRDLQDYFGFDAPQAIYKWQKGTSLPTVDNLLALSELLNVPMESILVRNTGKFTGMNEPEPDGSFFFASFCVLNQQFNDNPYLSKYNRTVV